MLASVEWGNGIDDRRVCDTLDRYPDCIADATSSFAGVVSSVGPSSGLEKTLADGLESFCSGDLDPSDDDATPSDEMSSP